MAVTLTVGEVAAAIRVGDTTAETAEVTRLLAYAITTVSRHLGTAYAGAPDAVVDEAAVRLVGYLYDSPTVSSGDRLANSLRNSGAAAILLPYRLHRAGLIDDLADWAPVSPGGA